MSFNHKLPLPMSIEPYGFQVAGHSLVNMKPIAVLKDTERSIIYKSFQDEARGLREAEFYRRVHSPDAADHLQRLRKFIANFYGVFHCSKYKISYLGLTDLLSGFHKPNICDLKLGTISYMPNSSAEVIQFETNKYKWRSVLGIIISGMQIYDQKTDSFTKFSKSYGREFDPEEVYTIGLRTFIGQSLPAQLQTQIARCYVKQLGQILDWYVNYGAKHLTFCRSSLLLAHEASSSSSSSDSSSIITCEESKVPVRVFLIDFAHCYEKQNSNSNNNNDQTDQTAIQQPNDHYWSDCELTSGFRTGLVTIIRMMERLIDESCGNVENNNHVAIINNDNGNNNNNNEEEDDDDKNGNGIDEDVESQYEIAY